MNRYHTYATLRHAAPLLPVEVTIESDEPISVGDLNQFLREVAALTTEDAADQLVKRFGGVVTVTARVEGVDISARRTFA